ncbi:phosphoribosylglycinamide formyltransferase [Phakopsora pachyrhizi]|uniref:phosphoribosylglycinamide formyltransferase 1 n=1 Tax=Phakopsora pachyrhizi TaxID=170000 RepID=A0AAV0B283_PHAPC|nr:phosphoribosylglycinamide formyltransferase [Phakopsora pachyrhizi]
MTVESESKIECSDERVITLNVVVLISGSGSNLQALIDNLPKFKSPSARISLVISNSKYAYGIERARGSVPEIPTKVFSLASFRKCHDQKLLTINQHQREGTNDSSATTASSSVVPEPSVEEIKRRIRIDYDRQLAGIVKSGRPHLVVLAGFMHILSKEFLDLMTFDWKQDEGVATSCERSKIPVINLHPALPGQFDGSDAIRRAYDVGPNGSKQIDHTGVMVHEVISQVDKGQPIITESVMMIEGESFETFENRMHEVEHDLIVRATFEMLSRISKSSP